MVSSKDEIQHSKFDGAPTMGQDNGQHDQGKHNVQCIGRVAVESVGVAELILRDGFCRVFGFRVGNAAYVGIVGTGCYQ